MDWIKRIFAQEQDALIFSKQAEGYLLLKVYVQPNGAQNEIIGPHDDCLKVKVAVPPLENKANTTLCTFLAKSFGVPKTSVSIIQGLTSRRKLVKILTTNKVHQLN